MSEPYLGEIQAFPFAFALQGFNQSWIPCSGQLLPIQHYATLFSLIGTFYGGDGRVTFALPNLNGAVAIGQGAGPGLQQRFIGEMIGSPSVTLVTQELPAHSHTLSFGDVAAANATPGPGSPQSSAAINPLFNGFVAPPANLPLAPSAMTPFGGGEAHTNMQPTQALVWCIAIAGIFPAFG